MYGVVLLHSDPPSFASAIVYVLPSLFGYGGFELEINVLAVGRICDLFHVPHLRQPTTNSQHGGAAQEYYSCAASPTNLECME
jgi:hypothetical protein